MWYHRTLFRLLTKILYRVSINWKTGRYEIYEYHILNLHRTEIGGNRARQSANSVSRMPGFKSPIRQPRNNHSRLPIGRLRRK